MALIEHRIHSELLANERSVWIQLPELDQPPRAICVLLDGEYYLGRMNAAALLAAIQASAALPPLVVVYVSHVDGSTRWQETSCNERFAHFIVRELAPWIQGKLPGTAKQLPLILGGLSLTGLAAAHAALVHPTAFAGVFCQSASLWWSDLRVVADYRQQQATPPRFRISCGSLETVDYVEHGPNMIQRTSQLTANRSLRDVLLGRGCDLSYEEFVGGHDIDCWRDDLPRALAALLPAVESPAPLAAS